MSSLLAHRKLACGLFLSVVAAGIGLLVVLPPVYQARVNLLTNKTYYQFNLDPKFRTTSSDEAPGWQDQTPHRQGLASLAEDPNIAAAVGEKLGDLLDARERLPRRLSQNVRVETHGDVLQIVAEARTAEKAAAIASAWATEFATRTNYLMSDLGSVADELAKQVTATYEKYRSSQARLESLLKESHLDSMGDELARVQDTLGEATVTRRRTERLMADVESVNTQMASAKAGGSTVGTVAIVVLESAASAIAAQIPEHLPQFQLQLGKPPERSVSVEEASRTASALLSALRSRHDAAVQVISDEALQQRRRDAQVELESLQAQRREATLARDTDWEAYQTLNRKVAENEVTRHLRETEIRVAAPALPPEKPIRPNIALILGLAVVTGCATALLGVVLADDVRVHDGVLGQRRA